MTLGRAERCCRTGERCTRVDKSAFTAEEWSLILASPMLAGMAVTLADPGGILGTLKEGAAGASALMTAKKDKGTNAIARAIAADVETPKGCTMARDGLRADFKGKSPSEMKAMALDGLRQVNAILSAKAPDNAPGFCAWLKDIAANAAEASSEGGFRKGGGSGTVQLTLPDGTVRVLQVENGSPVAVDPRPGESTASFGVARDGDTGIVTISDQSSVIPDAAMFGGCPC